MASIPPRLPWQKSELLALLEILHTSRRYGGDNTDQQLAELLKRKDIPSEPGATKRKYNESLVKLKIKSLMDRKLIPTSNEMKAKVEEGTSSQDVIAACAVNLGCFDVFASRPENGDQGLEDNVLEGSARIGRDTEMDMHMEMANISDMGARVGISGRRKTSARQQPYPATKPRLQNTSKESNKSRPQASGGNKMGMSGLAREVNDLSMAGLSNTSSIARLQE
ncbi:hypothetical protein L207DRAFT_537225 [Hyaloscypha variabilis F]|uniref:Uncharacterized protein n=1 Tax=Hyaloscypha variabilis (strain UAMH 11265 / GT02V1 / F) TaxID=1149755 RepID=A0A2J6QYC2_HYAVF|nr:hypothetical protein L207DRAFT_537225 [Hyaloscypha variabilis F]